MGPLGSRLAGTTSLVIVPQGFLWRVPFETLAPAGGSWLAAGATIQATRAA